MTWVFFYLGTQITAENNISAEIRRRITLASRCLYGLSIHLRSKMLSRTTKLKLYNTLIVPVLIYCAEAWTLTDSDERMLDMFERKVLRTIYGPFCVDGEWRTLYNHELYSLYKDDQVTKKIRVQRLRWIGHLARMDDENVAKHVFERNPEGRRRRGRSKLRWKGSVLEDYQKLGVGLAWRTATLERAVWRGLIH